MQFREPFLLPNDTEIIITMFDMLNTNSNNYYYILQTFTHTSSIHLYTSRKYLAAQCILYAQDISIKIEIKAFNPTTQQPVHIYINGAARLFDIFRLMFALPAPSVFFARACACHVDWYNIVVWWNTTQRSSSANNRIEKVIIAIIISYYTIQP